MANKNDHYRRVFNSPYLSSMDVDGQVVLTISHVTQEIDKTKKTKDEFNTAYFAEKEIRPGEKLKPMILNRGNSEVVRKLAGGSPHVSHWKNIPVTIYVDQNVKMMGEIVSGLRVHPEPPQMVKDELLPNTEAWGRAVASYKKTGSLDIVKQHVTISSENETKLIAEAGDRQPGEDG